MRSCFLLFASTLFLITSCNRSGGLNTHAQNPVDSVKSESKKDTISENPVTAYDSATVDEESAGKVRSFLSAKYKDAQLTPEDRKFSFYAIDLNDDGLDEYMIHLYGGYNCGTGGCNFYLLNNDLTENSYFTVTNPPIFRSSQKTNGWHDLILFGDMDREGGVKNYIHLKFDKKKNKYPGNPSVISKTDLAPGGHDFVMWSEDFSQAKVFTF